MQIPWYSPRMAVNPTTQAWKNCAQYRANLRNTFRMLFTQRPKPIFSRVPKILIDLKLIFYFQIIGFSKFSLNIMKISMKTMFWHIFWFKTIDFRVESWGSCMIWTHVWVMISQRLIWIRSQTKYLDTSTLRATYAGGVFKVRSDSVIDQIQR